MEKKFSGLSDQEVTQRINEGKVNNVDNKITKSYKEILINNTVTFFNMINVTLLVLLIFVGSYKNTLFFLVIIINTIAGIYQEIKAKITLDRLKIIVTSKIDVIRNGITKTIAIDEIVLDDYLILHTGMQIPSDSILVDGYIEANEALLTGEADPILKQIGDKLFSGSFVTAGKGICKVIHVGDDNYTNKIANEAKKLKKHDSKLNQSLNMILKYISIIIIPLGLLLFLKQYLYGNLSFNDAIVSTVAAIIGMIPEGLVLLTSIALTISVLHLAKQKTLVQELFCIETLARVDTLCLDKTGTITEGTMKVEFDVKICNVDIDEIIGNLINSSTDENVTSNALKKHYSKVCNYKLCHNIPFSSDRKYSGASFYQKGTYYLGAYQFLFPQGNDDLETLCNKYADDGYRILVLAHSNEVMQKDDLPLDLTPYGIIVLSDVIRKDAKEILAYFDKQGVDLKVISGDDPLTVSAIAKKAGLKNANHYIDASTLKTPHDLENALKSCSVFGRVTPQQKKEMVLALKRLGHTVAMSGDGVNDVLAFKEADCSIAMAAGSDAAKNVANLVLLDNNFSAMPHIVNEGRRVINNITMSASMFLIKTIFSIIISIATIFLGQAYPFEPIQLSLISTCGVGIPTFFLTYEANFEHVKGNFLSTVLEKSFPFALTIAIGAATITNIGLYLDYNPLMLATICILFTGWNYLLALLKIYRPLTLYRRIVIYITQLLYFILMLIGQQLFELTDISFNWLVVLLALIVYSSLFIDFSSYIFKQIKKFYIRHKKLK
ncbi:MAG: HAD-IC family P-type ATPase [[Clostridium] spiroforme]|uniref:HAD-IC family P-type ATPase n=1 Tax=Thomasclavelia spiroformis TaxID=29348 RepID=A0A943EFU8_9FIRM|nr:MULTISPECIES: HAD-IC family P-type ATPase [Thomasclavelia]MBS5588075.1 HAD-IC family P-type ATPase [Thomasclavelia spiroformis]